MPEISVTLIQGDKCGVETDYRDTLPVNMYPVLRKILGADGYMIDYPGLATFCTGFGKDRGAAYNERQEQQYRISGQKFVSVASDGTVAELGDIPGVKQGSMPYSFNTQAVISDGRMFLYDTTSGFRQVTDQDIGQPLDAVWVDGYYFLTDGEYIYHTDLTDESAVDPLKFATAEFMPDPSLGVSKTQDNKVIVWGRYTAEYFVNAATSNFAFQRVETRAQKIGIVATHAKVEIGDSFYIVGGRKDESIGVHRFDIGKSTKVSTREVDRIIEQYTEPELIDIRVEARSEKDVSFVIIHLPNETAAYCVNTGSWILLKTRITGVDFHRAINGVFDARNAKWIYGDRVGANIGSLTDTSPTQYTTDPQEWTLYTPLLKLERASLDEIEAEILPGYNDEGDATAFLSLTYDGVVYGKEILITYGTPNNYGNRFIARRLGYVSDWVGIKIRGASRSRMAFGLFKVTYG